jgi:hypothetical protein
MGDIEENKKALEAWGEVGLTPYHIPQCNSTHLLPFISYLKIYF